MDVESLHVAVPFSVAVRSSRRFAILAGTRLTARIGAMTAAMAAARTARAGQAVVLESPSQGQMPDGNAETADDRQDHQDVQELDPGGADCVEAAHRFERDRRAQHICIGAITQALTLRLDQGDGHVLEGLRAGAMTDAAVADRLALVGELVRLRTGAGFQAAAQDGLAGYAATIERLQQFPQRLRIDAFAA